MQVILRTWYVIYTTWNHQRSSAFTFGILWIVFKSWAKRRFQEGFEDLSSFSNDELCILWRAFDRLQLMDRPLMLKFLTSSTQALSTNRCGRDAPPRYSSFTLWNWVIQAHGFRNMKQYPDSVVIAKSIAKRLMVDEEQELRAQGRCWNRRDIEPQYASMYYNKALNRCGMFYRLTWLNHVKTCQIMLNCQSKRPKLQVASPRLDFLCHASSCEHGVAAWQ